MQQDSELRVPALVTEPQGAVPGLVALAFGVFTIATGGYVFVGVLEPLAEDLLVSVQLAAQLATVFALTRAVGSPLLVSVTSRLARRPLMLASLLVFTLSQAAAALAPDFETLVAARVLAALGAGVFGPLAFATGAALVPVRNRGRALSFVASGLGAAFVLGVPLGTLLGGMFGWRASFVLAGVLGILAMLGVAVRVPVLQREAPPQTARRAYRSLLGRPALWLTLLITTLGFVSAFVVVAFVGPLLSSLTGSASTGVGLGQFLVGVGAVGGIVAGGQAADRVSPTTALVAVISLLALSHLALSVFPLVPLLAQGGLGFLSAVAALALGSFAVFAFIPLQQNRLVRIAPDSPELALALNGSAVFLGQGLGAALGGVASSAFGIGALGTASAVVAVLGLIPIVLLAALGKTAPGGRGSATKDTGQRV